ncbi:MAG: hypothetical protein HY784_18265 [Chloroflexi bacterium]|nr:hypothetical protein [Chloroflexota bacterium]
MESQASSGALPATLEDRLRRYPALAGLAAIALQAAGPLSLLGAQILYLGQPGLSAFLSGDDIGALARALEDPARRQQLVERLERLAHD